jgi:hypothetical protein
MINFQNLLLPPLPAPVSSDAGVHGGATAARSQKKKTHTARDVNNGPGSFTDGRRIRRLLRGVRNYRTFLPVACTMTVRMVAFGGHDSATGGQLGHAWHKS